MKQKGFTIVELMIVLTLAALLLSIAAPSFQETMHNNRMATQANDFISAINLVRSEAIKRGVRVTICKSANGKACVSNADGYEQGWIVFSDLDENAVYDDSAGSDEELIRVAGKTTSGFYLKAAATSNNVANYISYVSNGSSRLTSGGFQAGTIELCNQGKENGRAIIINSVGRVRVEEMTCPFGI